MDTIDKTKDTGKPDLSEATCFLKALDPNTKTFCFQTYDDNPNRELKNPKLAWHGTGTLIDVNRRLISANSRHAGVLVAINPMDGLGRAKRNVTGTRALLLDLDGEPIDPVYECALKPHIITETSEGRYHVLWLVAGLPLDQWEDVQRGLAKRFDGDPAVASLERCTRLPGFFQCKDIENRFRVHIVKVNPGAPHSVADILKEFPPEKKAHKIGRSGNGIVLPVGAPLVAAEQFLKHRYAPPADTEPELPSLVCYRGAFYKW
jgi:RepB DNA-primase from phage plasmid